jgi:hypothetical protein
MNALFAAVWLAIAIAVFGMSLTGIEISNSQVAALVAMAIVNVLATSE